MGKIMNTDKNLLEIKNSIKTLFPGCRVILFGSRGRGDWDDGSDYDILVVTKTNLGIKEKRQYAVKIRKKLAIMGIPVDVLVRTEYDISYYGKRPGNVVTDAVRDGITL